MLLTLFCYFIGFEPSPSLMNSMQHFSICAEAFLRTCSKQLAKREWGFSVEYVGLLVLFAVSPCPFSLIKHLEHERRQITASDTGVLVRSLSLSRPSGYITCVPQGWLWHGSCHCWGPPGSLLLRPGWPSFFDGLSPRACSSELGLGLHPTPLDPWP